MQRLRTLIQALEDAAATDRGYRYVRGDGSIDEQPYSQLFADACRIAASLHDKSFVRGTLIGIVAADPRAFLTAFAGISAAGLVPAPLQTPAAVSAGSTYARLLAPTLRVSRAPALLVDDALADRLPSRELGGIGVLPVSQMLASASAAPGRRGLDEVALVQFTSGSTAAPRGVVLTHRAIAANTQAIGGPSGLAFTESDRGVSWLPLYHDMGLVGMALSALYFARTTTFLTPLLFLKRPVEWLRTIARERGTVSFAPNFAYDLCVRRITDAELAALDLSSWRIAGCGGEPIREETLRRFATRFAAAGFDASSLTPCYGLAEHTLAVTLSPPGRGLRVDAPADRSGPPVVSCGVSCRGHELRIVNEEGAAVPDRVMGEIEVRGPSLMREYFAHPQATAEVMDDGWLRTGDLGYTVAGELYVCGRLKEIIVLNGQNYFPQDIESVAGASDAIRRIVALGIDREGTERLVIVAEAAGGVDREALAADVRRRVADTYGLTVDEVLVVPAGTIPMTTSGKPRRARLREQYMSTGGGRR